jgi:inner membrane protein
VASIFSHAAVALALAPVVLPGRIPVRLAALGAFASVLPDADVAGFRLGIAYGELLGHRGVTHSLPFAALLALALLPLAGSSPPASRARIWLYLALATASHGVLDALTNGGLGVAFVAPLSGRRYFFPVQPIEVSPIGAAAFFSAWGRRVIASELLWIWLPSAVLATVAVVWRRSRRSVVAQRER